MPAGRGQTATLRVVVVARRVSRSSFFHSRACIRYPKRASRVERARGDRATIVYTQTQSGEAGSASRGFARAMRGHEACVEGSCDAETAGTRRCLRHFFFNAELMHFKASRAQ